METQREFAFGYRAAAKPRGRKHPLVELKIDNFAGGGGASTGIEEGTGEGVDVAINHDESALTMHEFNHPFTRHIKESVWKVDPMATLEQAEQSYQARMEVADHYKALREEARTQSGLDLVTFTVTEIHDKLGIEPVRKFYSGKLADGTRHSVEEQLKPFEGVRRYDKWFDNPTNGERCYYMRYEFRCWSIPTEYKPVAPEVLIERQAKRVEKKEAKAKADYEAKFPLLVMTETLEKP